MWFVQLFNPFTSTWDWLGRFTERDAKHRAEGFRAQGWRAGAVQTKDRVEDPQ